MRRRTQSVADLHEDWLTQVETEGPFLALPVIKDIWPDGVERLGDTDDRMVGFKQAFVTWQHEVDTFAYADRTPEAITRRDTVTRAWVETVLDDLAGWDGLRIPADELPSTLEVRSPGEQVAVRPSGALKGRDSDYCALLLISDATTSLRDTGLDGWAASEIDRMAMLLRKARVEVGIVTDGQWWAIVWAKEGKPAGSGVVSALTWAEEPLLRDAFLTLIDQRRFRAKDAEQRLPRLFERSELEAEEITEALGTQVRRSVELLVQAFSEARLAAVRNGDPDPLTEDPDDVYQAAVTVMMRVVFLLFAEEREILPTEQLYWESYAIRDLLTDLKRHAANGEEPLDESFDAWHRLLAVSQALYAGVNYDEMRMPAYGGSLLDPARFPWLSATDQRGLRLRVSDRVMMHVLESVQTAVVRGELRRVSFRDVDVEQIGYIYEGLLGYSCALVEDQVVLGLVGKEGEEPEIDADSLQELFDDNPGATGFTTALLDWIKADQPAAKPLTSARMQRLYDAEVDQADMRRLLTPIAGHDDDLLGFLIDWSNYIRRDLRGIPLVVAIGGLVVVETPSRRNAGAHYTPRSLAEEVVLHALQPLVYDPGPLLTNDENAWRLRSSSAILDLKVADIAAGSGAFLVAAARYLADRVTEAWIVEGRLDPDQRADPQRAKGQAIREVIARCLYGADINPMAVEMCKLSLWLVSMDKTKPFSFVDDKIFCGNSLLGLTSLDQLRQLHIHPDPRRDANLLHEMVDVNGKVAEATRLRTELAASVDERNLMRSTRGKLALLEQFQQVTADLRRIADGIVAAGLPLGGKPGGHLDGAYKVLSWELSEAFPPDDSEGDFSKLEKRIDFGLTPIVTTDFERWKPLHWVVEAPDVFVGREGFDAIVGNPPFLSGRDTPGTIGKSLHDWVASVLAEGRKGRSDLVAFFVRRAAQLCRNPATLGLIATNSIGQGDTRAASLDLLVSDGWEIYRAWRSRTWPSRSAGVEFATFWSARGFANLSAHFLDGFPVSAISAELDQPPRAGGLPYELNENRGLAFQGAILRGQGFLVAPEVAGAWIAADPANEEVLLPFLGGDDVGEAVNPVAPRWVIEFADRSLSEARKFLLPFARVERDVLPVRQKVKQERVRLNWWQHEARRPAMRTAIAPLESVLALTVVSDSMIPARVNAQQVFSNKLVVFASDSYIEQAVLSSIVHWIWAVRYSAKMRIHINYTIGDVFNTLPRPFPSDALDVAGRDWQSGLQQLATNSGLGPTQLLARAHANGPGEVGVRMRQLLQDLDEAVLDAYGWSDLACGHELVVYRELPRFSPPLHALVELLDRLLELNHVRARSEGHNVPGQHELP